MPSLSYLDTGSPPGSHPSFEDACRYFIEYGGLVGTVEGLIREFPTCTVTQLRNAAYHARDLKHRPEDEVSKYLLTLLWVRP